MEGLRIKGQNHKISGILTFKGETKLFQKNFLTCTGTLSDVLLIASSLADNCSSGFIGSTTSIGWEELQLSTVSGNGWKKFDKSSSCSLQFDEKSDNRPERIFLCFGRGARLCESLYAYHLATTRRIFRTDSLICCITTLYLFSTIPFGVHRVYRHDLTEQ